MKRRKPVNRLLEPLSEKQKAVKQLVNQAVENKKADRVIKSFQRQFQGKSLLQLLPVMIRRCSDKKIIRKVVERIERNRGRKFSFDDRIFLDNVKKGLEENEKEKKKEEEKCH